MNRNCIKLIRTFHIYSPSPVAQHANATRGRSTRLSKSSDPNPTFLLFIDLTYIPLCADIVSQTVTYDPSLSKSVNGLIFNRPRPRSSNFSLSLFLSLQKRAFWFGKVGREDRPIPPLNAAARN